MWYELVGYVIGIKHEKVANGHHTFLGIYGLPEPDKVLGERHRRFESYADHLQAVPTENYKKPIMGYVKPGSRIVLRFFADIAGPRAKVPGALVQYIEEVLEIDDHYFDTEGTEITKEQAIEIAAQEMKAQQEAEAAGQTEHTETPVDTPAEETPAGPFTDSAAG